jgi:hypothetical protein
MIDEYQLSEAIRNITDEQLTSNSKHYGRAAHFNDGDGQVSVF